ncbi:leucine-rich repeat-containing protein 43 [Phyllobates terribilis]|uniref:leucine-rich repeat-containing protein 43 n=1 Tax=Phyllobates terribilis TaxID=111132 RepID=UPI003CCAC99E
MDHITVSETVRQQLEALCLKSFPCGIGSWNKSHHVAGKRPSPDTYWDESDPDLESQDTLRDLLKQPGSPWEPNDKFNSEVQHLRELAMKCPENITDQFICSYFKQLRVVDKELNHAVNHGQRDLTPAGRKPSLVSLDLGFNDLTDLFNLVSPISTLQNLRILVLQGNPLTFITSYRGYTIDFLPKLCVLDDVLILPDEKYKFSGLSKKKEVLENKAKFYVRIGKVQGIPNPHTEQQLSGYYPVTTVTYSVCYEVIEDQPSSDITQSQSYMCSQLQMTTEEHVQRNPLNLHTGLYKTIGSVWNETIEYEYVKEHTSSDLLSLKSFFLCGMNVTVIEEKTLSWPKDPEDIATVSKLDKNVGGKDKKKERAKSGSRGSKMDGKNKKKKENLIELRRDPPVVKTLGSAEMPLKNLVSGERQTSSICNLEQFYNNLEQRDANNKSPQNSNKTKERKVKSGRENIESPKTLRSSSGKEKRKDAEMKATEEPPPPIVSLAVEISVQLMC